jgi:SAM-dependent methyltransferase
MDGSNYSEEFYDLTLKGSLDSARLFLGYLFTRWVPNSVVGVGCGRGTLLAACKELGAKRLVGFDSSWVTQDMMLDPAIEFRSVNLADEGVVTGSYDLALSMEVAEHLPLAASDKFISTLVGAPNKKFLANGYLLFDIFRQEFWDNENCHGRSA